ncbi:hypothetical protein Tco_0997086 [Tanacetum coccineum]
MFAAIPSLRARDCSKNEKEALNYLFLLVPLLNVTIPFFLKSFALVWSADTVAFFAILGGYRKVNSSCYEDLSAENQLGGFGTLYLFNDTGCGYDMVGKCIWIFISYVMNDRRCIGSASKSNRDRWKLRLVTMVQEEIGQSWVV